jgi:hypothetical protein
MAQKGLLLFMCNSAPAATMSARSVDGTGASGPGHMPRARPTPRTPNGSPRDPGHTEVPRAAAVALERLETRL